jgi:hypothetical protein
MPLLVFSAVTARAGFGHFSLSIHVATVNKELVLRGLILIDSSIRIKETSSGLFESLPHARSVRRFNRSNDRAFGVAGGNLCACDSYSACLTHRPFSIIALKACRQALIAIRFGTWTR